jgi:alkylated DNA repair dioxygenase AlkB
MPLSNTAARIADMAVTTNYSCEHMDIDVYSKYLSISESADLLRKIVENPVHFKHAALTKAGAPSKKRNKTIYGSRDTYTIVYRGKIIHTPIRPWDSFPELHALVRRLEETTGQTYNTCVIQIYNSGAVGIKSHRDKEMIRGTNIVSISLGETRAMRFERTGCEKLDIPLEDGALCVIKPPTNEYWLHSIPTDDTTGIRVSLVFRNF